MLMLTGPQTAYVFMGTQCAQEVPTERSEDAPFVDFLEFRGPSDAKTSCTGLVKS